MSEKDTGRIVRRSLDLFTPSPLTPEMEAQLKVLDAMTDEDIDFSDAPRTTDFSGFRRYPDYRAEVTRRLQASADREDETKDEVKIEADVLEFFRKSGNAPSRINEVLREYANAHHKTA